MELTNWAHYLFSLLALEHLCATNIDVYQIARAFPLLELLHIETQEDPNLNISTRTKPLDRAFPMVFLTSWTSSDQQAINHRSIVRQVPWEMDFSISHPPVYTTRITCSHFLNYPNKEITMKTAVFCTLIASAAAFSQVCSQQWQS